MTESIVLKWIAIEIEKTQLRTLLLESDEIKQTENGEKSSNQTFL